MIDFIKPGQPFTVLVNTEETDLTADGDLDVLGAHEDDGNYATLEADLIASGLDNAVAVGHYTPSDNGFVPYYKVRITNDANQAGEEVKIVVIAEDQ